MHLTGHIKGVFCLSFSPDGRQLASGSYDDTIRLWDVTSGVLLGTLKGKIGRLQTMAFSADGRRLASQARNGTVGIYDLTSYTSVTKLPLPGAGAIALSTDGSRFACVVGLRSIHVGDTTTATQITPITAPEPVTKIKFSSDGSRIHSTGPGETSSWTIDVLAGSSNLDDPSITSIGPQRLFLQGGWLMCRKPGGKASPVCLIPAHLGAVTDMIEESETRVVVGCSVGRVVIFDVSDIKSLQM